MRNTKLITILILSLFLLSGCKKEEVQEQTKEQQEVFTVYKAPEKLSTRPTKEITTFINLDNSKTIIEGSGAIFKGNTLTITSSGVYEIKGTLKEGQIIIDAKESDIIELVLSGVNIKAKTNSALNVKSAKEVLITLRDKTKNSFEDAKNFIFDKDEKPNSTIYSTAQLNIGGTGTLIVDSNFKHGINSTKNIIIEDGTIEITSQHDSIKSKENIAILGGTFNISSGDDGMQADKTLVINDGDININECVEGIEGTVVQINNGSIKINSNDDSINAKVGIEELEQYNTNRGNKYVYIEINNGTIEANGNGDVIDSNGDVFINGGTIKLHGQNKIEEGAIICTGTVIIKSGELIFTGNIGQELHTESQPIIIFKTQELKNKKSTITIKDKNNKTIMSLKTKKDYQRIGITSSKLVNGETYKIYINKKLVKEIKVNKKIIAFDEQGKRIEYGY